MKEHGLFHTKKERFSRKFHIRLSIRYNYETFCIFAQVRTSPQRRHVLDTMAYHWHRALRNQQLAAPSCRPVVGHAVPELLALHLTILSTSWRTPTLVMWWINLKSLGSWVKVSVSRPCKLATAFHEGAQSLLCCRAFSERLFDCIWFACRTRLLTAFSVIHNIHWRSPRSVFSLA